MVLSKLQFFSWPCLILTKCCRLSPCCLTNLNLLSLVSVTTRCVGWKLRKTRAWRRIVRITTGRMECLRQRTTLEASAMTSNRGNSRWMTVESMFLKKLSRVRFTIFFVLLSVLLIIVKLFAHFVQSWRWSERERERNTKYVQCASVDQIETNFTSPPFPSPMRVNNTFTHKGIFQVSPTFICFFNRYFLFFFLLPFTIWIIEESHNHPISTKICSALHDFCSCLKKFIWTTWTKYEVNLPFEIFVTLKTN